MLAIQRRLDESIDIGSARITLQDYRRERLELLIVIGKAISLTSILEGHDLELYIDGAKVVLGFKPDRDCGRRCTTRFMICIEAPPQIAIYRREVPIERRRRNGHHAKGLAHVE